MYIINNPLEQFEIYYIASYFSNRSRLTIFVIVIFNLLLFLPLTGYKIIPNNWSIFSESIYESIKNMTRQTLGSERYRPFIYSSFIFILFSNLLGLIPYSYTVTSQFVFCFSMSIMVFLGVTILGRIRHKLTFFSRFVPAGTPLGRVPLLVLIEFVSYFARSLSLGIRLAANMLAGHSLLKIISTFSWKINNYRLILLPLVFRTVLFSREFGIARLQAYVWTTRICSYIRDSIQLH